MSRRPHPFVTVVASGIAVGVVTQVLQGELPDALGPLANSGLMWALAAFALGSVMPSRAWAAGGGAGQLVIASIAYYRSVAWFEGIDSGPRGAIVWSFAGVVAGSVFGLLGHTVGRRGTDGPRRRMALAVLGGVMAGEGAHLVWSAGNAALRPAGIVELVGGIMVAAVALARGGRPIRRRAMWFTMASWIAAGGATLLAGAAIDQAFLA